jgi:hypothetical protein
MNNSSNAPLVQRDSEIIRMACLREEFRISQLDERFEGDEEFILTAIVRGWSIDQAILEYGKRRSSTLGTVTPRKAS